MYRADPHQFAPFADLASHLLRALEVSGDGAHDEAHVVRVWQNAKPIHSVEGGDLQLLAAAVLLHDCVSVPKNSPHRSMASQLAADKARSILESLGWPAARAQTAAHAILTHSYSAGIEPASIEGQILQDADRLDAIGFVGIARCFYTAGRMGSLLYDPSDPEAKARQLQDARFALDHFPQKLLNLSEGFKTDTGRELARERHNACLQFYRGMLREIT